MTLLDIAKGLQTVLAKLQGISLWPPTEAVRTLLRLVETAARMATVKPGPQPENIELAAAEWHKATQLWEAAELDLGSTQRGLTVGVWDGEAGEGCRSSLFATRVRFDSVSQATQHVGQALRTCATDMARARSLHDAGHRDLLSALAPISLLQLPWDLASEVSDRIAVVGAGIGNLIRAYTDADRAIRACGAGMQAGLDGARLPRHTVPGLSAIDQTNLPSSAGGYQQDTGPLRGNTAQRAQQALEAMSPDERAQVERLLEEESDPEKKPWILAAIGSGLTGTALAAYARQLGSLDSDQMRVLDPLSAKNVGRFTQPDRTTCGSSTIVMSRMINDPAYAMYIQTGIDPRGVLPDATGTSPEKRFGHAALAMHDETNEWWPQAWGTLPQAVDDQMSHPDHPAGVPGTTYRSRLVDLSAPEATYDAILDAVSRGHTVPLYSYGINEPGSGAHVTLVVGASGDTVTVYEPGEGKVVTMTRNEFNQADLRGPTSWTTPLSVSLPED
ncbi:MAG: hypothetical protein Q3997_07955 [Propionibacteriaceae bacterium]|nr:hypothetical protein [Propionibacteriaceae bacterium]